MSCSPSLERIHALLESEYGLRGELRRVPGENHNYEVRTDRGRFVLKLASDELPSALIEVERMAVDRADAANLGLDLPRLRPTRRGDYEARHDEEAGLRGRLLEFVAGTAWGELDAVTPALCRELGSVLARLGGALAAVDHPAARRTHRWNLADAAQHRASVRLIHDAGRRRLVEWGFHLFAAVVAPRLDGLPAQLIHGDANDENVLVTDGRISGLLDFGDCLHNPAISELAIALAYVMLGHEEPFGIGAEVVAGYHAVRPLSIEELRVLYPLVVARLCVTVTVAAERRAIDPDHPTWFTTEPRAWELLERLARCDPAHGGAQLCVGTGVDPFGDRGASVDELLVARQRRIGPSLKVAYRAPLKLVRGAGQYLFDDRGRPFLDLVNNVCHVGHCHPRVVAAGQAQMAKLNTNTRYLYDGLTEYAERLCATLPEPLEVCFFVNSGSEANELALRLCRAHTGRRDLLVVDGAYHGHTETLIACSPYKFMGRGGAGRPEPWLHVVPVPDGYRGLHKGQGREAGVAYGDAVGRVIADSGVDIAGFLTESLLSCGGQVVPPDGYFARAFEHVRAAGGLCIVDEVQVGFGRVGTHFWAFEMHEVVPDIVVMGKPIGNGHPMAAVVTTRAIAESFANGMEYFATFGGNPVSCAIGIAVLDVIEDERLQEHAAVVGTRLLDGLRDLATRHTSIGDVRGAGLFVGIELVRDRETLEPATAEADELVNRLEARGMLLSTDGPFDNVIKIKPPMVLSPDDVDMFVRALDDELP